MKKETSTESVAIAFAKFILLCAAAIILSCMVSCNPQKQLAKAENKVLANPNSLNKIGKVWEQTNPCNNDTVIKADTVKIKVPVAVEPLLIPFLKYKYFVIDTSINGLKIHVDSFGLKIFGSYLCTNKTITNSGFVTDNRRLGLARDSLANYRDSFALFYANFEAAKDSIVLLNSNINTIQQNFDKDKSSVSKTFGWFVSAFWHTYKWWLLLFVLGFGFAKFKSKIFKLLP